MSKRERLRSAVSTTPDNVDCYAAAPRLLVTRAQAARMLGCSTMTLFRAEARGALKPIRLDPRNKNAMVRYTVESIRALAESTDARG